MISPPYDVIDDALQEELYRSSPYNVVRLDYGRVLAGDDENHNRYTRAADSLRRWLAEGVLLQDSEPCIYYIEEDYQGELGEPKTRKGFVATVRLEDPESGLYLPHEKTLAGPKADRLKLLEGCQANFSPIFSLYDDPAFTVQRDLEPLPRSRPPLTTVRSREGSVTRLWKVDDPGVIRGLRAAMHLKSFFIADGHHRYETALTYRDLRRKATAGYTGREPWNYVMMYFTNLRSPGLTIFPTHRAVFGLPPVQLDSFLEDVGRFFEVEEVRGDLEALLERLRGHRRDRHAFGLVAQGDPRQWVLVLRNEGVMDRLLAGRMPKVLRTLDVTVLHSVILEGILGIDERAQEEQRNLRYVKGARELVRSVREAGEFQLGFLMNPTRVDQVKAVAEQRERMPQKSTFFHPKLVTGLVINPLFGEAQEEA
ncbi:MAG: DUF1015 domain-containing protein [Deferrisomatales bacterium]